MNIALLADIHGNSYALSEILKLLETMDIHEIIVAGDIIGGPDPDRAIDMIRRVKARVIAGNQEQNLVRQNGDPERYESLRWALIRTINSRISGSNVEYLTALPDAVRVEYRGQRVLVVHSTPDHTSEVFYPDKDLERSKEIVGGVDEEIFVCGHSHKQWDLSCNGTLGVNPGSVGFPIASDLKAQFSVLRIGDEVSIDHHQIDYDRESFVREFREAAFCSDIGPVGKAILCTLLTGRAVLPKFIRFARSLQEGGADRGLSDEAIWAADEGFDWDEYGVDL